MQSAAKHLARSVAYILSTAPREMLRCALHDLTNCSIYFPTHSILLIRGLTTSALLQNPHEIRFPTESTCHFLPRRKLLLLKLPLARRGT